MRTFLQEDIRLLANKAVDLATGGQLPTVRVRGTAGTLSSALIAESASILSECGFTPIVVCPPHRHVDTPSLALLDLISGLVKHGAVDYSHLGLSVNASWSERMSSVRRWLANLNVETVVLLVDDFADWQAPGNDVGKERMREVVQLLTDEVACPKIFMANELRQTGSFDLFWEQRDPFADPSSWGELEVSADRARCFSPLASGLTPEQAGVLVALCTLMQSLVESDQSRVSAEIAASLSDPIRFDELFDQLVWLLRDTGKFRRLWSACIAASVPRRRIPKAWISEDLERLSCRERLVFDLCMSSESENFMLAETLKLAVSRLVEDSFMRSTKDRVSMGLRDRYLDRLDLDLRSRSMCAYVDSAEIVYLSNRQPDPEIRHQVLLPFSDQLAGLGMSALEKSKWGDAVQAFQYALEIDPEDAASCHYLAFSFDNDGIEVRQVEKNYRRALELESEHVSWHARFISFLITQARMDDARALWRKSCARLLSEVSDGASSIYGALHLPVASDLLARAELGFGYLVLDDVPRWIRPHVVGYEIQRTALEVLDQAEEIGTFVPAGRATSNWWLNEPELLSKRNPEGLYLQVWIAAGVESVSDEGLNLSVATVRLPAAPTFGTMQLTWDQLDQFLVDTDRLASLRLGGFLEIGFYGLGSELSNNPVVRILKTSTYGIGVPPALPSDRYIRRARW
jgi:tetratricopeptide (TPR) repeat protein